MPTDNSKQPQQVLELPPGVNSVDELAGLVNDRIQQLNISMQRFVQNPALGAADLGLNKIVNLADPKDDLDGVNLRTLRKFGGAAAEEKVVAAGEHPTIYFTFDGLAADGQESPFAQIMANRAGFTPTAVSVCAVTPPTSDCEINLQIEGVDMLADNLVLPAGDQGPVFTTAFALGGALPKGTLIQAIIVVSGDASQVTIGLSIRGK